MGELNAKSKAIAVVHQSGLNLSAPERARLRTRDAWRVKNWEKHPADPGWHSGRYCLCYKKFRNATTRQAGDIVVDCVNDKSPAGYAVRSYFRIFKVKPCQLEKGNDLTFRQYYFCDGEPYRLRIKIGPSGTRLRDKDLEALCAHPSYTRYAVSPTRGPKSVANADWRLMVRKARVKRRHLCP